MRFDCIHCRKATTKPQSVKGAFLRMLTGKLCRLYKYLGLKRFEQHDTARAKDCPRFLVNQDEMNEELKHFESLNEGEYTELSGKTG